jgi:predicted metal-dependent RNase
MKNKLLIIGLLFPLLVGGFIIGYSYCAGSQVVTAQIEYVEIPVIQYVDKYVDRIITVESEPEIITVIKETEKIVEKIVYKDKTLSNFTSEDELREFLSNDDSEYTLDSGLSGVPLIGGNCAWRAIQLQSRAFQKGKILSVTLLYDNEYYKLYRKHLPTNVNHAVNLAVIDKDIYIIEPDDDRIWLVSKFN